MSLVNPLLSLSLLPSLNSERSKSKKKTRRLPQWALNLQVALKRTQMDERASEMLGQAVLALHPLLKYAEIDLYASATNVQSQDAIMYIFHVGGKESIDDSCSAISKLDRPTVPNMGHIQL